MGYSSERLLYTNNLNNGINVQILTMYRNFIYIVYKYVEDTYIDDVSFVGEVIDAHFDYCWGKASKDFSMTGINFNDLVDAKKYFKQLFVRLFYDSEMKHEDFNKMLIYETLNMLFEFKPNGKESQILIINNIYKLFRNG